MAFATRGYNLGNAVASVATVPSGQTWRVAFLTVNNTGTEAQELLIQLVDASTTETRVVVPSVSVQPKMILYPLSGDLVLNAGDQLQARGPTTGTVNLTLIIVTDDGQ